MARDFSGASQHADGASNIPITANPFTLHIKARRNSTTTESYAMGLHSGSASAMIGLRGDVGGDPIQARVASTGAIGVNAGTYVSDTWTACTLVIRGTGASDIESYKDNTMVSGSNAAVNFSPNNYALIVGAFPGPANYLIGMVAQMAMWSVGLTAAEIASLVAGFSPRRVRPQSLVAYYPLVRDTTELVRRIGLTETNSPTVFAHPRSYGL